MKIQENLMESDPLNFSDAFDFRVVLLDLSKVFCNIYMIIIRFHNSYTFKIIHNPRKKILYFLFHWLRHGI